MGKCTIFCFSPGNFCVGQIGPPLNFFVGHLEFEWAMARDLAQEKSLVVHRQKRDPGPISRSIFKDKDAFTFKWQLKALNGIQLIGQLIAISRFMLADWHLCGS